MKISGQIRFGEAIRAKLFLGDRKKPLTDQDWQKIGRDMPIVLGVPKDVPVTYLPYVYTNWLQPGTAHLLLLTPPHTQERLEASKEMAADLSILGLIDN